MTDSVILIQINASPDSSFEKPILRYIKEKNPSVVIFDFDNFSEESLRKYAVDLVAQSRSAAIIVQCKAEEGPFTGLIQFFNHLQQLKHPQLLILRDGPLPEQLVKMMKIIGGNKYRVLEKSASETEVRDQVDSFLKSP